MVLDWGQAETTVCVSSLQLTPDETLAVFARDQDRSGPSNFAAWVPPHFLCMGMKRRLLSQAHGFIHGVANKNPLRAREGIVHVA